MEGRQQRRGRGLLLERRHHTKADELKSQKLIKQQQRAKDVKSSQAKADASASKWSPATQESWEKHYEFMKKRHHVMTTHTEAVSKGMRNPDDWRAVRHGDGTFDNMRVLSKFPRETSNDEATAAEGEAGAAAVGLNETERECAARQKVCVGFFGITRSTKVTHRSAWRHVLNPIKDAGARLKIFLHTYKLSHANNERAGERNVTLDGQEWKLLKPTTTMFEKQDRALDHKLYYQAVRAMLIGKRYIHYEFMSYLAFKGTMMNIGRQGHSLHQVSKLMRGHNCTRVVFARPDVMFVNDVDTRRLLQCDMPDDTWYIPDFAHWGGVNDRLAFGNYASMQIYGARVPSIQFTPPQFKAPTLPPCFFILQPQQ